PRTSGTGTSSNHSPGSALAFTTAFIILCTANKLSRSLTGESTKRAALGSCPTQDVFAGANIQFSLLNGVLFYLALYPSCHKTLLCIILVNHVKTAPGSHRGEAQGRNEPFASTRWTIVIEASDSATTSADALNALSELCRIYWRPLY